MLSRISEFLAPPIFADDDKTRTARLLYVISEIGLVGAVIHVLILTFITRDYGTRLFGTLIAIPILFFVMALVKKGYVRFAAFFVVMTTWIGGNYITIYVGGVRDVGFGINLIVVLEAGMLISLRAGLVFGALSSLVGLGMAIAQTHDLLPPLTASQDTAWSAWSTQSLYLGLMAGLLYISVNYIQQSLVRAKSAEARLRGIIDNAPDIILETDRKGIITLINRHQNHYLGKQLHGFIHTDDITNINKTIEQAFATGEKISLEMQIHAPDDTRTWNSVRVGPIAQEGKVTSLAVIVTDITERKLAEQRIQNQLERLNALQNIDNAIKSNNDLGITLKILLNEVTTQLKVDAATILLFNHLTLTLDYAASRGFHSAALHFTKLWSDEGYAGQVMANRKTIHIPDLLKTESQLAQAISLAGENFTVYVGSPLIAKGQVVGVLEIFNHSTLAPNPDWFDFLDILAGQAAIAIENAQLFENLQRSNFDLALAYDATIEGMSRALDLRDKETEGHTQRVTTLTVKLAQQIGVPETEIINIRRGALLHDIGKLGVPDNILLKPEGLTSDEWIIMRKHTTYAYDMLFPIQYLRPALDIPYCHHEKWDGTGYPRGLKGEQIPLAARIFAVVDFYDALISDRSYRKAWSKVKTFEQIRLLAGTHFDPKAVEWFFRVVSEKK